MEWLIGKTQVQMEIDSAITEHRKKSKERRGLKCFEEYLQRKKKDKEKKILRN